SAGIQQNNDIHLLILRQCRSLDPVRPFAVDRQRGVKGLKEVDIGGIILRQKSQQFFVIRLLRQILGKAVDLGPHLAFIIPISRILSGTRQNMDPLQLLRNLDRYGAPLLGRLFLFLCSGLLNLRLGVQTRLTTVNKEESENEQKTKEPSVAQLV